MIDMIEKTWGHSQVARLECIMELRSKDRTVSQEVVPWHLITPARRINDCSNLAGKTKASGAAVYLEYLFQNENAPDTL
jgi:hypothetical protein